MLDAADSDLVFSISLHLRVFMLLSCIGQRSLSNSGVLEGLLNLLGSLLSPLQQPQAAAQRRTEGKAAIITVVNVHFQTFSGAEITERVVRLCEYVH